MPVIFSNPIQFAEALQARAVRSTLIPTSLTSQQLAELISPELLERGTFSAQVTSAAYLDEIDHIVGQIVSGELDEATGRLALKDKLAELDYTPAPGEEGSLTDFSSNLRTNLVIDQNVAFAYGYGDYMQGQDEAVLDQWPAQELYRAADAVHPRDWTSRWNAAADSTQTDVAGFVALKNTPIWSAISRFGVPYPPFDYGSHMRVRDVDRDRAVSLGLIDADTQIQPATRDFNQDLKFSADIRSDALRQALLDSNPLLEIDENGVLGVKG